MEKGESKNNHPHHQGNFYQGVFLGVVVIVLVFISFLVGLKVGREGFEKRYPPMVKPWMKMPKEGFIPKKFRGHGVAGVVDSVSKESFVVKSRWGELVTVLVDKNTKYKVDGKNGSFSDVKKGKNVMVIGQPQEEELAVKALIVRVF